MKTERLNIKETLPIVRLKTHLACNYKYVILSKDLKTGLHVRCKCKRKRKWKCKRVDTSKANTRKERYASAVEAFFTRWLTMIELLPIHTCEQGTQMRAEENGNLFITCVDACVCIYICVGLVPTSNYSFHLRLFFKQVLFHSYSSYPA